MSDKDTLLVNNSSEGKKRNPYAVWFVVFSFIFPVVLAYILFFLVDVKSFTNRGEILDPIVHIGDFELKNDKGEFIAVDELTYKWRLISFVGNDCDEKCSKRLHDTRQIHASLAKRQHRVIRMFVHLKPADEPFLQLIEDNHEEVVHVHGNKDFIVRALKKNIRDDVGISNNEVYIMDPRGNVMMRFTQDQPNKDFLFDLKKLLKASQIG